MKSILFTTVLMSALLAQAESSIFSGSTELYSDHYQAQVVRTGCVNAKQIQLSSRKYNRTQGTSGDNVYIGEIQVVYASGEVKVINTRGSFGQLAAINGLRPATYNLDANPSCVESVQISGRTKLQSTSGSVPELVIDVNLN